MLKVALRVTALALLHCLLLVAVMEIALPVWGRPRGVAFGILLYYSWLFFSLLGIVFAAGFEYLQPKTALGASILVTLAVSWLLWPGAEPTYYLTRLATAAFCLALWWLAQRRRRAA